MNIPNIKSIFQGGLLKLWWDLHYQETFIMEKGH